MHRRVLAKSTKETHVIAAAPVPVDERVSISRLRVDMTSRPCDVRSGSSTVPPIHLAHRLLCAVCTVRQEGAGDDGSIARLHGTARRAEEGAAARPTCDGGLSGAVGR